MAKQADAGTSTDPQGKTDKDIAAGYTGAIGSVDRAIEQLSGLRDSLRDQGVTVGEAGEVRRRAQDAALYDLAKERQLVKDGHAREDAEREAAYQERIGDLEEREEQIAELLGMPAEQAAEATAKDLRAAFDKKVLDAETAAAGKAKGMAEREAAAAAKLAAAEAATASALLKQENEQLKKANADLSRQNGELLTQQQGNTTLMAGVAKDAFAAAGGVVQAGNTALGTAASGGQRPGPRG